MGRWLKRVAGAGTQQAGVGTGRGCALCWLGVGDGAGPWGGRLCEVGGQGTPLRDQCLARTCIGCWNCKQLVVVVQLYNEQMRTYLMCESSTINPCDRTFFVLTIQNNFRVNYRRGFHPGTIVYLARKEGVCED